jgi:ABC-type glycerol-3-phosphate transport system substrate-binding protein
MKNNFKITIMAMAIAFIAVSCGSDSSVDAALSQIEKAMDKVEKNKSSMTEADWQVLNEELEQPLSVLNKALEDNKVSALKKLKISAAALRFATVAGEAALHTVTDSLKIQIEDSQITNEQIQEMFNNEEMTQAMQELEKVSEELQKINN